jgi:Putative peptidoglycan binding domain/OmpA family
MHTNCNCPSCVPRNFGRAQLMTTLQELQPEAFEYSNEFEYGGGVVPSNRYSNEYSQWVQASLNQILGLQLAVDGVVGPQTRSAIRDFQNRQGLLADGVVGPITEAAILAALGQVSQQPPPTITVDNPPPTSLQELRTFAECLVREYVPSDTGDSKFNQIAKDYGGMGTTCGFLCHWLLWRLGCTNREIVNRNEPDGGYVYRIAQNISRLWNLGRTPFLSTYNNSRLPDGNRPQAGDLVFIKTNPADTTGAGEHVFVFLQEINENGIIFWESADAGQRNSANQECARIVKRRFDLGSRGGTLSNQFGTRHVMGWLPLDNLQFGSRPMLDDPEIQHCQPSLGEIFESEVSSKSNCPRLEKGFRRTVLGWGQYRRTVEELPSDQRAILTEVASAIRASHQPDCTPVKTVTVNGHADFDTPRNPTREKQFSEERARLVTRKLQEMVGSVIEKRIKWEPKGLGATQLKASPTSEANRRRNRRVEILLLNRGIVTQDPPSKPPTKTPTTPPSLSKVQDIKVVIKSFINVVGGRIGAPTCFISPPVPPILPPIPSLRLALLAAATDVAYSEDPKTDRQDKTYRLFSECTFKIIFQDGKLLTVTPSNLTTDAGLECIPQVGACLQPPDLLIVSPVSISGRRTSSFDFSWRVKGRPHLLAEPSFQSVCLRTSVFIWHTISGRVDCSSGTPVVTILDFRGSEFPSHRLFVNGAIDRTIPQRDFSRLWIPDPADSSLVK